MHAGEDARGEHGRGEAGAFLVGPVDHHDRVARLDAEVVEGADQLEPAEHAEHAVIAPAGRLGVEMAADLDRRQARVGALAAREHGAHRIDADGQARRLAPALEQRAALRDRHRSASAGYCRRAPPARSRRSRGSIPNRRSPLMRRVVGRESCHSALRPQTGRPPLTSGDRPPQLWTAKSPRSIHARFDPVERLRTSSRRWEPICSLPHGRCDAVLRRLVLRVFDRSSEEPRTIDSLSRVGSSLSAFCSDGHPPSALNSCSGR